MNQTGDLGQRLEAAGFHVQPYPTDEQALAAFHQGLADAVVLFKPPANASVPAQVSVTLPDGDLRATITLTQLKKVLESYESQLRDQRSDRLSFQPVELESDAKSGSFDFVYSLLVPLLVFLPVVLSGALCADSLTEEVQRGTLPILLASPATPADVIEGKLLANVAITPLLSAAWFLLLAANHLPVPLAGALLILVLATAIAFLMGLLACGIALATRDRNKSHLLYASAMFLMLGASLALPVSPVNAVALLAAGSASAGAYALVAGVVVLALGCWLGLRVFLKKTAAWMAAGGA
jgi:ABC-type Na+ efflux pump permease subunit